jgi:hypothetical protein
MVKGTQWQHRPQGISEGQVTGSVESKPVSRIGGDHARCELLRDGRLQRGPKRRRLQEFPHLKVVVVSSDHSTISDVGIRTRKFSELSMDSIRASVMESLAQ